MRKMKKEPIGGVHLKLADEEDETSRQQARLGAADEALPGDDELKHEQGNQWKHPQAEEDHRELEPGHLARRRDMDVSEVVVWERLRGDTRVLDRPVVLSLPRDRDRPRVVLEVADALGPGQGRAREEGEPHIDRGEDGDDDERPYEAIRELGLGRWRTGRWTPPRRQRPRRDSDHQRVDHHHGARVGRRRDHEGEDLKYVSERPTDGELAKTFPGSAGHRAVYQPSGYDHVEQLVARIEEGIPDIDPVGQLKREHAGPDGQRRKSAAANLARVRPVTGRGRTRRLHADRHAIRDLRPRMGSERPARQYEEMTLLCSRSKAISAVDQSRPGRS